ncbi:MAG: hypothetical protein WDZ77_00810 [Candidatus Pacearchaeota archaeon]
MELIKKDLDQIIFRGKVETGIANSIRRYINRIPTIAIDEIEISRNDSPLYDETIAHRMGLVPLSMEGVSESKLPKIKLESKGEGSVYSGEIKGIKVIFDKIPLTTLGKDKELIVEGTTNLGMGEEHSKYSPGILSYRNVSEITVSKKFAEKIKELCPKNEVKEKGNKVVILDDKEKEILDFCEGVCNVEGEKAEVVFGEDLILKLESFGQLKNPEEVFKKSTSELKKDLASISKQLK